MVVLEVRILDKLGATYGPSFESMRRSGPVRFETRTGGKGRVCSAARQPCHGRAFNDVPRYLVGARGHHGRSYAEAASRAEDGCRISASRFTRSLSVLWHASGRNRHPDEARGESFF